MKNFVDCLSSGSSVLMEGALGERLKREYGLEINGTVAMADLIYNDRGRQALGILWKEYMSIAQKYNLPFLATTPTRRANKERVSMSGYDEAIIADNVQFLRSIRESSEMEMYIGGLMGCKGDAYSNEKVLNIDEATAFHFWQADLFRKAGIDFLYAGIMPELSEATGMANAMSETEIPYIISFTIQRDGRLVDGHTIDYAIHYIDDNVINRPVCYMTNCVHPAIVYEALSHNFNRTATVHDRFIGIQANTSALSYSELDGAKDLKTSSPADLAGHVMKLKSTYNFRLFGGCCGTDDRHMEEIARKVAYD